MKSDDLTQDKKTLILEAATKVLTSRGLKVFSFESVASEAGLSRQLVRHYILWYFIYKTVTVGGFTIISQLMVLFLGTFY